MDSYESTLTRLGERARALRILRGLQQEEVAQRADIGAATVRRFERTGRASIENVLRVATVLGVEGGFEKLFDLPKYRTLDEALAQPAALQRKRVRRTK